MPKNRMGGGLLILIFSAILAIVSGLFFLANSAIVGSGQQSAVFADEITATLSSSWNTDALEKLMDKERVTHLLVSVNEDASIDYTDVQYKSVGTNVYATVVDNGEEITYNADGNSDTPDVASTGLTVTFHTKANKIVLPGNDGCIALLKNAKDIDCSHFDVSNYTDMSSMFYGCTSLTALDLSNWDVSNVKYMSDMFWDCSSLTTLDVSNWNVASVEDMKGMFYNCANLTSLDVSGWDVGEVTDMEWMFCDCSSLTSLDVSGWDVGNVTDMELMFYGCSSLASLDVSDWNVANVEDMVAMFNGCSSLTSLDVSGWDTGNVTEIRDMFGDCTGLTSLDLSNWDTGSVTEMQFMFFNCSSLKGVKLSDKFDTSNVTNMTGMFAGTDIAVLDLSNFDFSAIEYSNGMPGTLAMLGLTEEVVGGLLQQMGMNDEAYAYMNGDEATKQSIGTAVIQSAFYAGETDPAELAKASSDYNAMLNTHIGKIIAPASVGEQMIYLPEQYIIDGDTSGTSYQVLIGQDNAGNLPITLVAGSYDPAVDVEPTYNSDQGGDDPVDPTPVVPSTGVETAVILPAFVIAVIALAVVVLKKKEQR